MKGKQKDEKELRLNEKWNLKSIDKIPEGVIPLEFDSEEEADVFLQSINNKVALNSVNKNDYYQNDFPSVARSTSSLKTYNRRTGNTWIAGSFYYEMDIQVEKKGSKKKILECTDGMVMEGWRLGFSYTESSRKFKIARDKQSVTGRAKGTIDYYLLINNLIRVYSEKYDWTIDFDVSEV